jgi:hypothetical protein
MAELWPRWCNIFCQMAYEDRKSGSPLGSLAMGIVAAVAGAIIFVILHMIVHGVAPNLSPTLEIVLLVFGYAVVGIMVGAGVKGGGRTDGGIVNRVLALILAYLSMAVAMTAITKAPPGPLFHQSIVKTFTAPFGPDAGKNFAIMAVGLILAVIISAGAETQATPKRSDK